MNVSQRVIDRFVDGLHVVVRPSCLCVDTKICRRDPVHPERFKIVKRSLDCRVTVLQPELVIYNAKKKNE